MPTTLYTGEESGRELKTAPELEPEAVFDLRPPNIPQTAVPVFDDELHAVVGYRDGISVQSFYDLEGKLVGMEEPGLEAPLIDPIDLIFFAGGLFRGIARGVTADAAKAAPRVAALTGTRLAANRLSVALFGAFRAAFRRVPVTALRFTETTAAHMATKGRYVPRHILHLALKFGQRVADPQGVKGAFPYTIKMLRNGSPYSLEVVVREVDWTILHFLYK